jgi:hypothetical protein
MQENRPIETSKNLMVCNTVECFHNPAMEDKALSC